MNKIIKFISNEDEKKESKVIIGFRANKKDYVMFGDKQLDSELSKEEQQKNIVKVFIAEMFESSNIIYLKGLYDEEYKLLASKIMNIIAVNFDSLEIYKIIEGIDINDFAIIDIEDVIKDKTIKEDTYFEPRSIQAPLYYLKGMQNLYNEIIKVIPEIEEVSEVEANEILEDIKKQDPEDKLNNIIDFKSEVENISNNFKLRKENDSKIIKEIITTALNKIEEIQENNELDVNSLEKMTVSNVSEFQKTIEAFAAEIQTIKDKANKLVEKYKQTKNDLKIAEDKIVHLEKVVASRDSAIIQVQTNLANETKAKELSNRKVVELENKNKELNHKLEEQQIVNEENMSKKDKDIANLNHTIVEQQSVISIFRSDDTIKNSNKKITTLEYEVVDLREKLKIKEKEVEDLKKELKVVSLDKDSYEQSSKSLTQLISSKNLEARELYDKIKELEDNNNNTTDKQYTLAA